MKCTPVNRTRNPAYPTRLQVLDDPELLKKNLPKGWSRIAGSTTVLSFLLTINGCVHSQIAESPHFSATEQKTSANIPSIFNTLLQKPGAKVAPIFNHGEGRGAVGCVVTTPPIFLSEEEALVIIREEMNAAGITLNNYPVVLRSVQLPVYDTFPGKFVKQQVGFGALEADGVDPEKDIVIEYISLDDNKIWNPKLKYIFSSVTSYDLLGIAKNVSSCIEKSNADIYFGTFYDPVVKIGETQNSSPYRKPQFISETPQTKAKALLRAQVQDFIEWLEGQGVI